MNSNTFSQYYNLKQRLQKSSNPNLIRKSLVPYGSRKAPYMCRLIKYYESDFTIFLLLEYEKYGKLYSYLNFLAESGNTFLDNLSKYRTLRKQNSIEHKHSPKFHRKSFSHGSMASLLDNLASSSTMRSPLFVKRTQSLRTPSDASSDQILLHKITSASIGDVDESKEELSQEKPAPAFGLEKSSSNSSNENDLNVKPRSSSKSSSPISWSINAIKKLSSNKLKINAKTSTVSFKNDPDEVNTEQTEIKEAPITDPYLIRVRLWLAQLVSALRSLHKMGIVCKDLRSDNLLLSSKGDLVLTYMSKWSLVDDGLNRDAIKNLYVAPELVGLVNYYSDEETCDWWSFAVIAYEMITMMVGLI